MKKEENLAATNQLIRFIRGNVKCEEFYDQLPEPRPEYNNKRVIITYGLPLLAGLLFVMTGYLILYWQLKNDRSRLDMVYRNLEAVRVKNHSPQDIETRRVFWNRQEALYKDLVGEKLSISCILKELSHLSPSNIFFKRIFLKEATLQPGSQQITGKILTLEGVKKYADGGGDFSTFLSRLNLSSFFQKVNVDYQREVNTGYGRRGLDFILTCELK